MFKVLAAGVFLTLGTGLLKGQSGPMVDAIVPVQAIKELSIGELVPDITFNNITNAETSTFRLSDFKGKVVVLDFWATFCTPCIEKMPYLDSIQKLNPDIVKILLVSRDNLSEDKEKVDRFLKKYKSKFSTFSLPIITQDSIASQYFPHKVIPHYVWIDKNGKLLATTDGEELNTEIIKEIYEGKNVDFAIKREYMNFKANAPLFKNGNGGMERNIRYKSMITGRMDGVSGGQYTDLNKEGLASKLFIRNVTLLSLFRKAYNFNLPFSQIVMDVKDKTKLVYDKSDKKWGKNNTYCYEIITSQTSKERLWKLFQHDIYAYFGMSGKVEKRTVKCLLVVRDDDKKYLNKVGQANKTGSENNHTVDDLIWTLNDAGTTPVFSGIPSSNDIWLEYTDKDISSLQDVRKLLNKIGLKLVQEERELTFLVISEE